MPVLPAAAPQPVRKAAARAVCAVTESSPGRPPRHVRVGEAAGVRGAQAGSAPSPRSLAAARSPFGSVEVITADAEVFKNFVQGGPSSVVGGVPLGDKYRVGDVFRLAPASVSGHAVLFQ